MPSPNQCDLAIVMPAYNEAGCIRDVVASWLSVLDHPDISGGRLIVVNDGSKDETGTILDELAQSDSRLTVVHQKNAGHGAALINAYQTGLALNPAWVFHVDSDDQFVPSDFYRLWEHRSESRFIIGFRQHREDSLHRLVITRILKVLNLLAFGVFIPDANIPFRLIQGDYLRQLLQAIPSGMFAPNIFLCLAAKKHGQNLMNIPVTHRSRMTGKVSIVRWKLIKVCIRTAIELIGFRLEMKSRLSHLV